MAAAAKTAEDSESRVSSDSLKSAFKGMFSSDEKKDEGIFVVTPVWNFFRKGFKKVFWVVAGLGVIALIIIGLIWGFNYFQSGKGTTQIAHLKTQVSPMIDTSIRFLGPQATAAIFGEQYNQYAVQSDVAKTIPDRGVKFVRAEQTGGKVFYGEPIRVMASVQANLPLERGEIHFFCKMEGEPEVFPAEVTSTISEGNVASLYKDVTDRIQVICVFPKGISPEKTTMLKQTGLKETIPDQFSKRVTIYANFEYITDAMYKTYFMRSDELTQILMLPDSPSPFAYYNIQDSQIQSDRTVKSTTSQGPINLGLGAPDVSQPFSEDHAYSMTVQLGNNEIDWEGNLKTLEKLTVKMPPITCMDSKPGCNTEKKLGDDCSFDYVGKDSEGFEEYELKPTLKEDINQECDKETLASTKLTQQTCMDLYGKNKDTKYRCNFHVTEIANPGISFDIAWAEAKYIYQSAKSVSVDAYKRPETTRTTVTNVA